MFQDGACFHQFWSHRDSVPKFHGSSKSWFFRTDVSRHRLANLSFFQRLTGKNVIVRNVKGSKIVIASFPICHVSNYINLCNNMYSISVMNTLGYAASVPKIFEDSLASVRCEAQTSAEYIAQNGDVRKFL